MDIRNHPAIIMAIFLSFSVALGVVAFHYADKHDREHRYKGTHEIVMAPDAKPAFLVSCGSQTELCFSQAIELCPKGYDLLGVSEFKESGGGTRLPISAPVIIINGSMLIRCKP